MFGVRRAVVVTMTAIFAALSIILTMLKFEIPYPVLPYLKFDFAEIPTVMAFFIINPYSGFVCSVLHWLFLMNRSTNPIGPFMKFAAVISMLIGFRLTFPLFKKFSSSSSLSKLFFCICSFGGGLIRVAVMSILNVIVLLWIAPGYLTFASYVLQNVLGYMPNSGETLYWTLVFTAIYNCIHVVFSIIPAIVLLNVLRRRFGYLVEYIG